MERLLAGIRSRFVSLRTLQYRARVRLSKQTRSIVRDFLARIGVRLGKWVDVRSPAAARFMDIRMLHEASHFTPTGDEHCRFLRTQTTIPVRDGSVLRGGVPICFLENAKLHVRSGTVCTNENLLLLDAPWERGRLKGGVKYGAEFPRALRPLKGTYSTIWGAWPHNHYHWLVEHLPRLYSLKCGAGEPVELLMPPSLTVFQRETLEMCLPDNVRVRYLPDDEWISAERFIFAPTVTAGLDCPLVPPEYFSYLRERIFRRFGLSGKHEYSKKIYISRSNARLRRLLNEDEVVGFLRARGFERYRLEDLSFEEQVRLFHQARVVVAPHGAGLTNTMFSGDISVVELLPLQPVPVYFFLTQSLGQRHFPLLSEKGRRLKRFARPTNDRKYRGACNADFHVEVGRLAEVVARAENSAP